MKIAALSDIHANWVAYQAVSEHIAAWQPDLVIVAGDIVNRGPKPAECWEFTQLRMERDHWIVLRGNHEDYVIGQGAADTPRSGPVADVHQASYWTLCKLGNTSQRLAELPEYLNLRAPDGSKIRVAHASMRGNRDGIYPETDDETLAQQIAPAPPLFIVGHTHRPLIRTLDGSLVVNVGSAGLPFDTDKRACYAQLTWKSGSWSAQLARVPYDNQAAERDFYLTGYLQDGGPLTRIVLRELLEAQSHLFYWATQYQSAALQGEINMAASVEAFLCSLGS